jgi:hypothetical protein
VSTEPGAGHSAADERETISRKVEELSFSVEDSSGDQTAAKQLASDLQKLGGQIVSQEQEIERLNFEITDAANFIAALETNLQSLNNADSAHVALGTIQFQHCPSCFSPIGAPEDGKCSLCHQPLDKSDQTTQLRLRREIEMQLRESKGLQEDRIKALKPARALLESLRLNRDQKFSEYRSITIRNPTKREQQLDEFNRALGRLDRQLEVLSERLKLAQRVNELIEEKAARNEQISKLRDLIEAGKIAQEEQRRKSYTLLSTTTREFLNRDLPREDSFQKAQHVAFDFGKEKISVDGRSAFAASSWVYLKNSFLFSILLSSLKDSAFRFPRILMLDGLEDKGMEVERIHHFQELIAEYSEASPVQHQLIFTAQTLAPELIAKGVVRGERYTHDRKALRLA